MSYSNDDDNKKETFLLLSKKGNSDYDEKEELPIYNINNLTNDESKILTENFFENDNHENFDKFCAPKHENKKKICMSTVENKECSVKLIREENDAKKSMIEFLNFLKNTMIEESYCFDSGHDHDITNLIGDVIQNSDIDKEICIPIKYLENDAFEILSSYIKNKN